MAMAMGELAYVNRPLYDYVQHRGAILGQVAAGSATSPRFKRRPGLRSRVRGCGGCSAAGARRTCSAICSSPSGPGPARQVLGGPHCAQATGAAAARRRRPIAGCFRVAGHPAGANPVRPQRNAPDREARGKGDPVAAHQVALRTWRRERPTGWTHDVSLPPFDPDSFGLTRVTRRLEGR
jgi:hypothetical protein